MIEEEIEEAEVMKKKKDKNKKIKYFKLQHTHNLYHNFYPKTPIELQELKFLFSSKYNVPLPFVKQYGN